MLHRGQGRREQAVTGPAVRRHHEVQHQGPGSAPELFEPGALKWDASLLLNRQHDRRSPIMRVTPIVVGDEVRIDQPLLDSVAGRSAAVEIRSGLMTGLSIEFKSIRETVSGGIRRISSALLGGVGLVDSPSYAGGGGRGSGETKQAADMAVSPWPLLSPWPTTPVAHSRQPQPRLRRLVGCSEAVAGRLGPVVAALVQQYASDAPAVLKSEAVIRASGWLHGNKPGLRKVGVSNIDIEYSGGQSALRHSGAMALLSPFKVRRAGAVI